MRKKNKLWRNPYAPDLRTEWDRMNRRVVLRESERLRQMHRELWQRIFAQLNVVAEQIGKTALDVVTGMVNRSKEDSILVSLEKSGFKVHRAADLEKIKQNADYAGDEMRGVLIPELDSVAKYTPLHDPSNFADITQAARGSLALMLPACSPK